MEIFLCSDAHTTKNGISFYSLHRPTNVYSGVYDMPDTDSMEYKRKQIGPVLATKFFQEGISAW